MKEYENQMEEGISLAELWSIFVKRFGWFLLTFIVVVIAALGYLKYTIPEYSSNVTVLVEPIKSSSSLDDMLISGMSGNSSKISTEVELIKSRKNLKSCFRFIRFKIL